MTRLTAIAALAVMAWAAAGYGAVTVIDFNPVVDYGNMPTDEAAWSGETGRAWRFSQGQVVNSYSDLGGEAPAAGPTIGSQSSPTFAALKLPIGQSNEAKVDFMQGTAGLPYNFPQNPGELISTPYAGVTSLNLSFDVAGAGPLNNNSRVTVIFYNSDDTAQWNQSFKLLSSISPTPSQWTRVNIPIDATTPNGDDPAVLFGSVFNGSAGIGKMRVSFYGNADNEHGENAAMFVDSVKLVLNPVGKGWNQDHSGNWNLGANWNEGIPNGIDATANLGIVTGTTSRMVYTEDTPITLGTLTFNSPNTYTVSGTGETATLTMQASGFPASIQVTQGIHKINLPLAFASDTTVDVATGATLRISDSVTGSGTVTKTGQGNLVYGAGAGSGYAGAMIVSAGTLELASTTGSVLDAAAHLTNNDTLNVTTGGQLAGVIDGAGDTNVTGSLTAGSIVQSTLTIGSGGSVTIRETTGGSVSTVPEPGTWVLIGTALLGWLAFRRRR